ncbi:MAG TPA: glycosyltransferase family 2 protein [Candidatus Blautia faecipullorum]|nr:glycosyltransferase family 2 protein [Candidatus Blautia faecipullorum]
MEKLYIIVPAYNEAENIEKLIDDWYPVIERCNGGGESRLVVINDGSTDDTYTILKKCAESRPLLEPLTKENGGHGQTLLYGYRYAIKNGADYIFQTDSDGQTLPEEFDYFWEKRKEYDVILGNRRQRQDGISRKFVEDILRLILRCVFGVNVPDANAPFRLMKIDLVDKYIRKMPENFNLPNVMLTTYFVYFKEKTLFVNITFQQRQGGKTSVNIRKIIRIGWNALGDFHNLKKELKKS